MVQRRHIFLIFCIVFTVLALHFQNQEEKRLFNTFIINQKSNILSSIQNRWIQYLLQLGDESLDPDGAYLIFDRYGQIVGESFFPNRNGNLQDWTAFNFLTLSEKNLFMRQQMRETHSWSRILALKRWKDLHLEIPQDEILSQYEKTLFNQELKYSYQLIFDAKNFIPKIQNFDSKFSFHKTLYKNTKNGDYLFYVPSMKSAREIFEKFSNQDDLQHLKLYLKNPFLIEIERFGNPFTEKSYYFKWSTFLAVLMIILWIYFVYRAGRIEKLVIEKKITFLNQLVHEINTPLTGIKLNAENIQEYGYDELSLRHLLSSTKTLQEVVEDIVLINNSGIQSNRQNMNTFELQTYFSILAEEFCPNIQINFNLNSDAYIDLARLRIIFRNLVRNAITYGHRCEVVVYSDSEYFSISVKDYGKGINKKEIKKIFIPFFRGESSQSISPNGLGIGLFIVKKLVTELNGNIEVINSDQGGAIFLVKVKSQK